MHPSAPACPAIIKQSASLSNYSHPSQSYEQRPDWIKALLNGLFLVANDKLNGTTDATPATMFKYNYHFFIKNNDYLKMITTTTSKE